MLRECDFVIEKIKTAIRLKSSAFDENELIPLMQACKADMLRAGVKSTDETNPLVYHAIVMYCKAYFGKDNDSERYRKCYESLRDGMALMGDDLPCDIRL